MDLQDPYKKLSAVEQLQKKLNIKVEPPYYFCLKDIWGIINNELNLQPFLLNSTAGFINKNNNFNFSHQEKFFNSLSTSIKEYTNTISIRELVCKNVQNEYYALQKLFYESEIKGQREHDFATILINQAVILIGKDNHPTIDLFLGKINKILAKKNKTFIKHLGEINDLDAPFFHESKESVFHILDENYTPVKRLLEEAIIAYKNMDFDKCALSSGRAFESALKCIFDIRGYDYNKEKDTSGKLIEKVFSNNFLKEEDYISITSLKVVVDSFSCGLPKLRNPSSHGPGSKDYKAQKIHAKLALDLAFSYIGFFVAKNKEYDEQ